MSLENIELGTRQQSQQSDKHLLTNMNTNNSLAFSQTFAQENIRKDQGKNVFIHTKQTLFTQKSEYDLPVNSNKKQRQPSYQSNSVACHHNNQKDVLLLVNSIKMAVFLNQQNNDRRKYIENKELTIRKMQHQISNLESKIKTQKEKYMAKFNKFKGRSDSLRRGKRSISERLKTEIVDYKTRIGSIKKRTSMNPTNCGTLNNTKQFRSKRHSQKYVRTERSQDRSMKIPYPYGYKNISIQQIYPRTFPLMNGYHKRQQVPNQFLRSAKPYCTIEQIPNTQNPQHLKRVLSNSQRPASLHKEIQQKQENLFDILGKHFKIPTTINSMESLAVQKVEESNIQSLQKSSISKKDYQQCISQKYSLQKEDKSQILDEKTLKLIQEEEKKERNSNPYSQTLSLSVSKKKSVRFAPTDFKIGNMGDSVQSQYTQTQRPFEARYRLRTSQALQKSRNKTDSASQASSISSVNDDIIDSIKLSSHSRIYKQKLAQSKYLPSSDDPQNLVENSQLQDLDLLAVSNISKKRADNSKQIRKKLESLGESINKQT